MRITEEGLNLLEGHDWPGNVRELKNVVTVAIAFASEGEVVDFRPHMRETGRRRRTFETFAEMDRRYLEDLYRHCNGNQSEMSRISAIPRNTLRDRLRKRCGLAD